MDRNSRCPPDQQSPPPPAEERPILLRAYAEAEPAEAKDFEPKKPTEWILVFDTETTDDETQRLRFGTFQLRDGEHMDPEGIFYDPDATTPSEQEVLRAEASLHGCRLFTVREFVERVFFTASYDGEATVVGFNLPFDLSRLALDARRALPVYRHNKKGEVVKIDRSMVGGFTMGLSENGRRPNVRAKHVTRRMSFINFADPGGDPDTRGRRGPFDPNTRGFFLDLKISPRHSQANLIHSTAWLLSLRFRARSSLKTLGGRSTQSSFAMPSPTRRRPGNATED